MRKHVYIVGSYAFAVALSGASIIIYVQSTKNAPVWVKISSIGSNFFINVLCAKKTVDFFEHTFKEASHHHLDKDSRLGKFIRNAAILLFAIAAAAPFGIATYNFSKGNSLGKKLAFSFAQLGGASALNIYSLAELFAETKIIMGDVINAISLLPIARIYYTQEEQAAWQNLLVVQSYTLNQLSGLYDQLRKRNINDYDSDYFKAFPFEASLIEKLNFIINDPLLKEVIYLQKSRSRKFVEYFLITTLLGLVLIGGSLLLGSTGYTCDTATTFIEWNFNAIASWLLANAVMSTLYIMSILGGRNLATDCYNTLFKGHKPLTWKITDEGLLGIIPLLMIVSASAVLGSHSGYTAAILVDRCPKSWQEAAFIKFVDYCTVIFNSYYVNSAAQGAYIDYKKANGKHFQKTYLAIENVISEVERKFSGNLSYVAETLEMINHQRDKITYKTESFLMGSPVSSVRKAYNRFSLFQSQHNDEQQPLLSHQQLTRTNTSVRHAV